MTAQDIKKIKDKHAQSESFKDWDDMILYFVYKKFARNILEHEKKIDDIIANLVSQDKPKADRNQYFVESEESERFRNGG